MLLAQLSQDINIWFAVFMLPWFTVHLASLSCCSHVGSEPGIFSSAQVILSASVPVLRCPRMAVTRAGLTPHILCLGLCHLIVTTGVCDSLCEDFC